MSIVKAELPAVTIPFTMSRFLLKYCPRMAREGVYVREAPTPNMIP